MSSVWHESGSSLPLKNDELRQVALSMLGARRAMRGTLPASLIHDVALEVLLSAYLVERAGISVEHLVAEADVPAELIERWVTALASENLIISEKEHVWLTPHGMDRMGSMLTSVVLSQRKLLGWGQH